MAEHILGIDLGTTSVKAAVFDGAGAVLAQDRSEVPIARRHPGWAEQDPADWTGALDRALAQIAAAGLGAELALGALTSQVNTHVFVDASGAPLMPAILWQDIRAQAEAAELEAQISPEARIAELGAPIPIDASHPLARMLWVARHRPEIWARTAHVLLPKDFALRHLTGRVVTDPLSNIGLVGQDGAYVAAFLEAVPGAAERMAPLAPVAEIIGTTQGPVLPGIALANATMDGWVGALGAGACRAGAGAYLSGTSEILGIASGTVTNAPGIVVFAPACDLTLHLGPTQSGGASKAWFAQTHGLTLTEMADAVAAQAGRGPTPLFLPQLAGERAPLWDASLRGAFLGLSAEMGRADLARAVYEGVAFSARHVLDGLEQSAGCAPDLMTCGGGGFRSESWGQIRADILGKPLRRLTQGEPGLLGAACIAAVAGGRAPDIGAAHDALARYDREWQPDPAKRDLFEGLFASYKAAILANAEIGRGLAP